jgi:hypothetical protein
VRCWRSRNWIHFPLSPTLSHGGERGLSRAAHRVMAPLRPSPNKPPALPEVIELNATLSQGRRYKKRALVLPQGAIDVRVQQFG